MTDMPNWKHRDEWVRHKDKFRIVVSHHTVEAGYGLGPHRWTVCAFIYPAHWHCDAFDSSDSIFQPAATAMPLHCGASLVKSHYRNSKCCAIQISADYNHLGDQHYTHLATAEDAESVFHDADSLFAWLAADKKPETDHD